MKLVQAAVRDEDNETYKTCKRAEEAAGRSAKGMTENEQEWEALAQVMSAQLPMDATEETTKRLKKREGEIDKERRGMVRAAEQQIAAAKKRGVWVEGRRRQMEEHRGWMKIVIGAWRGVVEGMEWRVPRLKEIEKEEHHARKESAAAGKVIYITAQHAKGGKVMIQRLPVERWWERMKLKIRALAWWAMTARKNMMRWYVRGEGGQGAAAWTAPIRANRGNGEARQRPSIAAVHSTREGVRLWWWIENGEGTKANGPLSVMRGIKE